MSYTARLFYSEEAEKYGIAEAVMLNYLRLFLRGNMQRGNNIDEGGKVWTYTTYEQIAEEHTFWSPAKVGRIVRKLRDAGVILAERRGYDGYTWFAFCDESSLQNRSDVATESSSHQNESVPSTIYTKEILKNTKEEVREFEELWERSGRVGNKKSALRAYKKLSKRQLSEVLENIDDYLAATNTDGTYPSRMHLSTYMNPKNEHWLDALPEVQKKGRELLLTMDEMNKHARANRLTRVADYVQVGDKWRPKR